MAPVVPLTRVSELYALGAKARQDTKYSDAEGYYNQALRILEQATAQTLNALGVLAQTREQAQIAATYYQRAYTLRESLFGVAHAETIESIGDLAGIYEELGNTAQAEESYEQALTLGTHVLNSDDPRLALALSKAARFDRVQKRYHRAEERFLASLVIYEKQAEEGSDMATVLNNLGFLYCEMKQYEKAELILKRAIELATQVGGGDHPNTAASLKNLARVYREQGNTTEAEALYQRALTIYKQTLGVDHSATIRAQESYDAFLNDAS